MPKVRSTEAEPAQGGKRLTARELLERAKARANTNWLPSKEALAELEVLMRENDKIENRLHRVKARDAIELLRSHGYPCERSKFARVIRTVFGRGWDA